MALDLDNKPYTYDCGICGGRGGHEVNDRHAGTDWEDCPHCRQHEHCYLCDREFDCRDHEPDRLLIGGHPELVCGKCWAEERD